MTGTEETWQCQMPNCGYMYSSAKGDEENNIPAGTPFKQLPVDWTCPRCGLGKRSFHRIAEQPAEEKPPPQQEVKLPEEKTPPPQKAQESPPLEEGAQEEDQESNESERTWQCQMPNCGYIYSSVKGDEENNIPAGTPFKQLPADWSCPRCGMGKTLFRPVAGPG